MTPNPDPTDHLRDRWTEAGGALQRPFIIAAGKLLRGERPPCPACGAAALRHYFHAFDPRSGRGTFWAWCGQCGLHAHLPRVDAPAQRQPDPYAALDLDAFAALETDPATDFMDRLDALWRAGALAPQS